MRVVTGIARGKKLNTLPGEETRPTASRVKEGLFSAIQFDIEGRKVLDLFAGCGQLGIEALSRGAEHAVFIDNSAEANAVILDNLKSTGLMKQASVAKTDSISYLKMCRDKFDIIFLDPPYHAGLYDEVLTLSAQHLSDFGMIICEYPEDVRLPEEVEGTEVYRTYRYGSVHITIFRKIGDK